MNSVLKLEKYLPTFYLKTLKHSWWHCDYSNAEGTFYSSFDVALLKSGTRISSLLNPLIQVADWESSKSLENTYFQSNGKWKYFFLA